MKKERISKFYAQYKAYLFPAIVALSSLFLIVVVIYPQVSKLISNQGAVSELVSKSNLLDTKVQALESYNKEDLSRDVNSALVVFPQDRDFGNVIGLMQQIAGQSGFTLSSISLGNIGNQISNANSFDVKMEAQGAKNLLLIFFNNLENSKRIIRVSNFDISTSVNPQIVNITLSVEVLYAPAPQTYGTVDSPLPQLTQKDQELLSTISKLNITPVSASPSGAASQRGKANPFQ